MTGQHGGKRDRIGKHGSASPAGRARSYTMASTQAIANLESRPGPPGDRRGGERRQHARNGAPRHPAARS